ncbi:YeiH family protein [Halorussus halophilus]|uniref:YeiH family protein n=1 Tax=Halorussus halophilus TaxID=2650975 RepID=UPI0013011BB7|nr:putative sulfate exporter family transporter [Halorussus halophilus]
MSLRTLLPGIGLLVAIGAVSEAVAHFVGANALLVAVFCGLLLANGYGVPSRFESGVETYKLWLETGIVLMGVRVSLDAVLAAGVPLIVTVVGIVAFTVAVVEVLSRRVFGLSDRLGSLLAAGASICGVSAVVAVAGSIDADEESIAYATSTVLLFDAVTLFAFPVVGRSLHLSDQLFGIWAGLSMFSTGPVTAAGFAYSDVAGQWATLTKLTRNVLLGVVVVAYSIRYTDTGGDSSVGLSHLRRMWRRFPKFVLGFVALLVAANVGLLSPTDVERVSVAYHWLFLLAFAGLGMNTELSDFRRTGLRPVGVLLLSLVLASVVSLLVARFVF